MESPNSSGSPARERPGKRIALTATQKQDICLYHSKNPKVNHELIALHFSSKFNLKVNRVSIGRVQKHKAKWLALKLPDINANKKRERKPKFAGLEVAMFEWLKQVGRNLAASAVGLDVQEPMLQAQMWFGGSFRAVFAGSTSYMYIEPRGRQNVLISIYELFVISNMNPRSQGGSYNEGRL